MSSSVKVRQSIYIRGIVQGVGFRPFVYGLALRYGLTGWVRNDSNGVSIEIEGSTEALTRFQQALHDEPPPLARIDEIHSEAIDIQGDTSFQIVHSQQGSRRNTLISADTATCADCLRELFDPQDRRYYYPFINCTNCGPRFTIVADVPYDRRNTTMHAFTLCTACQTEYENPLDRRFHAQPNACPACGPQLRFRRMSQPDLSEGAALQEAVHALLADKIIAIKGLGGYHLACDASNNDVIMRLRQCKQREAKPFALMLPDLETAHQICQIHDQEAALLCSSQRPIVLLRKHEHIQLPEALVPGYVDYGIMLPYTPLHHLLLHEYSAGKRSADPHAIPMLVMTSGNRSDEPIATDDADAFTRLADIVDGFLYHNRAILTRCDDSVVRHVAHGQQLIRRSRGYAPQPVLLDQPAPTHILAYGAHLKNTFCLVRDRMAVVSHHIGDLENLETLESFRSGIEHLKRLFDIEPELLAYDLHPGYLATQEAQASPIAHKIGVQHHHAHIASVLAENNLHEPVIGIAADGTGYGLDGSIWGGEILLATRASFERIGHLATVALPGGEQAVKQPWRVAASYLWQLYGTDMFALDIPFVQAINRSEWQLLEQMTRRKINSPLCSSMGRLFDAVAALIGLRSHVHYEGQAAVELEAIAEHRAAPYPISLSAGQPFQIDGEPIFQAIIADLQQHVGRSTIAGRFHASIAHAFLAASQRVRQHYKIHKVALSGGVFQNKLLLEQLIALLQASDFDVYSNRQLPPNDGGISFGQAAIAIALR